MKYVEIPNLPEAKVKLAVIDGRVNLEAQSSFKELGIELIKTDQHISVYPAIAYHPDIILHHIGGNKVLHAPETELRLLRILRKYGFELYEGSTKLINKYPGNIAYNVARVGDLAFHNLKYTDPLLKRMLENSGIKFVHVNQGYSKCAISIIDSKSIITSDRGIAIAAETSGLEVLLINQNESILLPGISNGFIGGSSCLIDKYKWAVTGNINSLLSCKKICEFLEKKGISIVQLTSKKLIDLGSILPLITE